MPSVRVPRAVPAVTMSPSDSKAIAAMLLFRGSSKTTHPSPAGPKVGSGKPVTACRLRENVRRLPFRSFKDFAATTNPPSVKATAVGDVVTGAEAGKGDTIVVPAFKNVLLGDPSSAK